MCHTDVIKTKVLSRKCYVELLQLLKFSIQAKKFVRFQKLFAVKNSAYASCVGK